MARKIRPLTSAEEARMVEIDFYLFIRHLLDVYKYSIKGNDLLESLADLFGCNTTLLKRFASAAYNNRGLSPDKRELTIMLYRSGTPVRKIVSHPTTLYRYLDDYVEEGQFEFLPRCNEEEQAVLKSFMTQLKDILDWR